MPFTSCRTEGDTPEPYPDGWSGKSYLKIDLIMPQTTRATDGDVTEDGRDWESRIHDLTVFIYEDKGLGINSSGETPFVHRIYADMFRPSVDGNGVMTVNVELDKEYVHNENHRIAVVANMGDRTDMTTLGDLHDYVHTRTWQEAYPKCPPSGCTRFTMASANNEDGIVAVGRVDPETGNTYYSASVKVERTAARIDLLYNQDKVKGDNEKYIEYTATAKDGTTPTGTVRLYGLSPINVKQLPSFALKRVSESTTEDYSCFGSYHHTGEIQSAYNQRPTAYVIEPHTSSKTDAQTVPTDWYAETSSAAMKSTTWDAGHNLTALLEDIDNIVTFPTGDKALILTYANENTHHYTQHSDKWLNGVLLRAVFEPTQVFTAVEEGEATNPVQYSSGTTFWCYRPSENNADELYFKSKEAAEAYQQANPTVGATILEFPQGHCFYHAWIKHAPDVVSGEAFPMQYGIVRNHIYRLSFVFQRAGSPEPSIEDPENVNAVIFVRPWNTFTHEQIII